MEPTQTYDLLPSVETLERYIPSSVLKENVPESQVHSPAKLPSPAELHKQQLSDVLEATQDFTLDLTDPLEPTQAYDQLSSAAQDFTLEPTQAYDDPDLSLPSLSRTPKSNSDHAKTPPKKPIESKMPTSTSLSFPTSPSKLQDTNQKAHHPHLPGDEVKQQNRSEPSNPTNPPKPKPKPDKSKVATTPETLDLKVSVNADESKKEIKSGRTMTKREAPTQKRKREAPSRKRKQLVKEGLDDIRKTKRLKVARDQKYDKDLKISSNYVKKCIEEVTDSPLNKKRFKELCRKTSKQLVGMWSKRKPSKKKSIEKWLRRRHKKILRLIEKYLQMELV